MLPDWGCHVVFNPNELVVVDRYTVEIEGLGTRQYSYSRLRGNYHIFDWPDYQL